MISVIIPYYHREVWKECIDSVRKFITIPYELIVIDARGNGYDPAFDVYLTQPPENGYVKAINQGFRASNPNNDCLLLNADAILTEGCVEELNRILYLDEKIGLVGARAFSYGIWIGPCLPGSHGNYFKNNMQNYKNYLKVPLINSECVLLKREMIDEIGYFDETFWHDGSDLEYTVRAIKHGWEAMFAVNTKVYHDRGRYKAERPPESLEVLKRLGNKINYFKVEKDEPIADLMASLIMGFTPDSRGIKINNISLEGRTDDLNVFLGKKYNITDMFTEEKYVFDLTNAEIKENELVFNENENLNLYRVGL